MGITNLGKFIKEYAPNAITDINYDDLQDKVIAIDTSIIIYQFLVAIKATTHDFTTKDGKVTSHIQAVVSKALSLLKKEIRPIFVFDGVAPEIKSLTLEDRSKIKKKAILELENLNLSKEDKIKFQKRSVRITPEQTVECKEILKIMGLPVIEAPGEADPQCALLVKNDIADAVLSEDMDILTFGSKKLIRGFTTQKKIKMYSLDKILDEADLTYNQFVDLCILLGCDYSSTIQNIGMKRAYDMITKHGSIENLIKNEPNIKNGKYKVPDDFNYKEARKYFMNPPTIDVDIKWNIPNYDLLKDKLINTYHYQETTVNNIIKNLKFGYHSVITNNLSKNNYLININKIIKEDLFD